MNRFAILLGFVCLVAYGQQTSISGTVTDATGGVVAGAAVRATPAAGGATASTITTNQGVYQFPSLSAGEYVVRIENPGFAIVEKTVSLLVGQSITIDVTLKPSQTSSTVDVIAEAAEVNTSTSQVAGNIDSRQMKDVPLNGRNWMELSQLVSGVTANSVGFTPLGNTSGGKFQINIDGQQVTQNSAGATFGQPQYSREAMEQFQIITNRFDATLGRSAQIQVNAQTRSGTNQFHGSAYGYFRNDALNAADPIAHTVLPFSDQQYGATFGGPILRDKLFFFGAYEGERQPSSIYATPQGFDGQSFTFPSSLQTHTYLTRVDYMLNSANRISARFSGSLWDNPFTGVAGNAHPSRAAHQQRTGYDGIVTWQKVFGPTLVNEVKGAYHHFEWINDPLVVSQEYRFPAITIGGPYNYPQDFAQDAQQYRDDLFWLKGSHSIKAGGEYLYNLHTGFFQQNVRGTVQSFSSTPSNLAALFPVWNDPSTWKLSSFSPLATSYVQGFGNFNMHVPRNTIGFWVQDDWKITKRLTLNLGLRYDNDIGVFSPDMNLKSGIVTPRSGDNLNFAPRVGFAYDLFGNRRTSIRGGAGIYFADIQANQVIDQQLFNGETTLQVAATAAPGVGINLADPFKGVTGADFLSGKVPVSLQSVQIMAHNAHTPYSFQSSIGVEHQFGKDWVFQADFVHWRVYHDWIRVDQNLFYDPATGYNLNPSKAGRPDSRFTSIQTFATPNAAGSIFDALQTELHKRLSARLQVGVAYTLSRLKDSNGTGPFYYPNNQFDLASEWDNSTDDQRHTLNANASYMLKWGFQTSLLYHFGSGNAYATTASVNPFGTLANNRVLLATAATFNDPSHNHAIPNTPYVVTDRDAFYGRPIHRVDFRVAKTIAIHERFRIQPIAEAFNLFNHSNYGAYKTIVDSSTFSAPVQNQNLAFSARMVQLAVRFDF